MEMKLWKSLSLVLFVSVQTVDSSRVVSDLESRATDSYPDYRKLASCPGYKATSIKKTSSGIVADLQLAGNACNVYGDDLTKLTLTVTSETGRLFYPSRWGFQ